MKSNRELDHEELLSEYIINKDTLSQLIEENKGIKNRVVSLISDIDFLDDEMNDIKLEMSKLNRNLQETKVGINNISKLRDMPVIGKAISLFLPKDKFNRSLESTLEEHKNYDYHLFECITNKKISEDNISILNEKIRRNRETIINLKNIEKDYKSYFDNGDD